MKTFSVNLFITVIACFAISSAGADAATAPVRSTAEEAARQQILRSEQWRRTEQYFDQWLSVQVLYNDQQVAQLKADLDAEIRNMSADELRELQQHVESMLQILLSREGNDARDYIGRYLSVLATHRADELRSRLPDVVSMTPEELRDYLDAFQKDRSARQHESAAFDAARQRQVAAARQHLQQTNQRVNRSWQQHQTNLAQRTTNQIQQSNQRSLDAARRQTQRSQGGRFYPGRRYGWGGFRW